MSRNTFSHQIETSADADAIWVLWMDVGTWSQWDTELVKAEAEAPLSLGAVGHLVPRHGPPVSFEVTAFDPGYSYSFKMPLPLAALVVSRRLVSTTPLRVIEHEVAFVGPLASLWHSLLGTSFKRALPNVMQALVSMAGGQTGI